MADLPRIVITGVGLTSPNGDDLATYRSNLLAGVSGVEPWEIRHFGPTVAGVCHFEATRYQKRKALRRGTRAGSIAIWCANEALGSAGIDLDRYDRARVGVYVGTTEHGNVETENEIYEFSQYGFDLRYQVLVAPPQSTHRGQQPGRRDFAQLGHPPVRHYTVGAACAAGNLGHHPRPRRCCGSARCDVALAGGVSESRCARLGFLPVSRVRGCLRPATPIRRKVFATVRQVIATASWWPKAAACTCWSVFRGCPAGGARPSYGGDRRSTRSTRDASRLCAAQCPTGRPNACAVGFASVPA